VIQYASLGSGSRGNGTLVASGEDLLLVDCGFTIKEVERRMARLGRKAEELSALLVTHEHGDHLKGVAPLARKFNLPVYMTPGTFRSKDHGKLPELRLIEGYQDFQIGSILVEAVAVPHDAREPAQFIFNVGDVRLGVLTDLGNISPHVEACYRDCDALVLEANHDSQMLASGSYHYSLKQRVGGPWGHLNNEQTAGFLLRANLDRLQQLVVAHISQQNNSLERAKLALDEVTKQIPQVIYACQDEGFEWLEVSPTP
jgi:phosphoribosyl 1,2-cyclic phosphodiesterase